ncbi:MAG: transposase [Prevotellaceae bacterium]|nr:transposase [Prevotellaceae bacterium]
MCFKQKIVEEIKQGENLQAVSRKYGICGSNTVRNWIKQLGQDYLCKDGLNRQKEWCFRAKII